MWGKRSLNYLKHHRKVLYYNLLTSGKLHSHLADTEEQAQQFFSRLVKQYAKKEDVTEELKATDMMLWVQKVNNISNRATEVVNVEVIFLLYGITWIMGFILIKKFCKNDIFNFPFNIS